MDMVSVINCILRSLKKGIAVIPGGKTFIHANVSRR